MRDDVHGLATIDLLTRHVYFRDLDEEAARNELRRRGWSSRKARALERTLLYLVAPARFLAWLDFDFWDLPTSGRDVLREMRFSFGCSMVLWGSALASLILFFGWSWWWLPVLLAGWPLVGVLAVAMLRDSMAKDEEIRSRLRAEKAQLEAARGGRTELAQPGLLSEDEVGAGDGGDQDRTAAADSFETGEDLDAPETEGVAHQSPKSSSSASGLMS